MDDTEKITLMEATHRASIELYSHYLGQHFHIKHFKSDVEETLYKIKKKFRYKIDLEKIDHQWKC